MRLFLIDKPGCHHIKDLMPGISSVYQLEAEFQPYLTVEFLPNRVEGVSPGIILQAGNEVIRRNYTFDDPQDLEDARTLIWTYLKKYHNVPDVAEPNGCIKNFIKTDRNKVIQGWQNKKDDMYRDTCCKPIKMDSAPAFKSQVIKREEYRYDNRNMIDRGICKKVRGEECGNNYPPNTEQYRRCVGEVEWLCNNGYPVNKKTQAVATVRNMVNRTVTNTLKNNSTKVNKQQLDNMLDAGYFQHYGNRMGNMSQTFGSNEHNVLHGPNVSTEYDTLGIEGFSIGNSNKKLVTGIAIILVIMVIILHVCKRD